MNFLDDTTKPSYVADSISKMHAGAQTAIAKIIQKCPDLTDSESGIICDGIIIYLNQLFRITDDSPQLQSEHNISSRNDFYYRCGHFAEIAAYNYPAQNPGIESACKILVSCGQSLCKGDPIPPGQKADLRDCIVIGENTFRLTDNTDSLKLAARFFIAATNNSDPKSGIHQTAKTRFRATSAKIENIYMHKPVSAANFFTSLIPYCDMGPKHAAFGLVLDQVERAIACIISTNPTGAFSFIENVRDAARARLLDSRLSARQVNPDWVMPTLEQARSYALAVNAKDRSRVLV